MGGDAGRSGPGSCEVGRGQASTTAPSTGRSGVTEPPASWRRFSGRVRARWRLGGASGGQDDQATRSARREGLALALHGGGRPVREDATLRKL